MIFFIFNLQLELTFNILLTGIHIVVRHIKISLPHFGIKIVLAYKMSWETFPHPFSSERVLRKTGSMFFKNILKNLQVKPPEPKVFIV